MTTEVCSVNKSSLEKTLEPSPRSIALKPKDFTVNRFSVLVVDDDSTIRKILSLVLEDKYAVLTSSNVDEAIDCWSGSEPDLIITDIEMGEKSGLHFIDHIRQTDRQTPIIVISGSLPTVSAVMAVERLGANKVLGKPFSVTELLAIVEELLDECEASS